MQGEVETLFTYFYASLSRLTVRVLNGRPIGKGYRFEYNGFVYFSYIFTDDHVFEIFIEMRFYIYYTFD